MKVTQVELMNEGDRLVCWLPSEEVKLKIGMRLELKGDDETIWTVKSIYGSQEHHEINRKWDAGGL